MSDAMIRDACDAPVPTIDALRDAGAPRKVAIRALEKAHRRGLVESGVSLATAWWIGPRP